MVGDAGGGGGGGRGGGGGPGGGRGAIDYSTGAVGCSWCGRGPMIVYNRSIRLVRGIADVIWSGLR